jgi:tripartite-type tricarboxylate transporter receptor subunit TctC
MDYPARQVRIIVPTGAGGPSDVIARLIAQKLTQRLGKPFYVENQPGAANNIGIGNVARAVPDGHTILVVGSNFTINPALLPNTPYDAVKDFAPVTLAAVSPMAVLVHPDVFVKDLKGLIAHIRSNPGKLSYASAGVGTTAHLFGEQLKHAQSLDLVHVPFAGSELAIQSTLGGHTPIAFVALTPAVALVKEGRLRALSVTSGTRSLALPETPTVVEAGLADLLIDVPQCVLVPAKTPDAIVALLQREIANALTQPDVKEKLASIGFDPVASSSDALAKRISSEIARWKKLVREAGISGAR